METIDVVIGVEFACLHFGKTEKYYQNLVDEFGAAGEAA